MTDEELILYNHYKFATEKILNPALLAAAGIDYEDEEDIALSREWLHGDECMMLVYCLGIQDPAAWIDNALEALDNADDI